MASYRDRVKDQWKQTSREIKAQLTAGEITEEDAIKLATEAMRNYDIGSVGVGLWSKEYKNEELQKKHFEEVFASGFNADFGDMAQSIRERAETDEKAAAISAELETLAEEYSTRLGVAKEEAFGFLDTGAEAAKKELQTGLETATGMVEEGAAAGLADLEAGKTAATGAIEEGLAGGLEQIEGAKTEAAAAKEAALGQLAPWQQAGAEAVGKYQEAFGMGEGGGANLQGILENLPGFQFRMQQGLQAAQRVQSARGGGLGGRAAQELQQVGQGLASEEFGRYLGGLENLMGQGLQAATTGAGLEAGFAELQAGLTSQQANMRYSAGQSKAALEQGFAAASSDLKTRTAAMAAGLITDTSTRMAAIETTMADAKARLTMGTAEQIAQTAGSFGSMAAGLSADFYKMAFSADVNRDIAATQMAFQQEMARWEANVASATARSSGMFSLFGNILGGAAAVGTKALIASDKRVKDNINYLYTLKNGIKIYTFTYKGSDTLRVGPMAQEVEKIKPHAVVEIDGIKHVNYAEIMA